MVRAAFQTFSTHFGRATRVAGALRSQPAWLVKLVTLSMLVALAAIGLLVVIPAVLLALLVFVIGAGVVLLRFAARSFALWIASAFRTSVGAGDGAGRRNVRVVPHN